MFIEQSFMTQRTQRVRQLVHHAQPNPIARSLAMSVTPARRAGVATAIGSLAIFAALTIGTIVALTRTATKGGYQIQCQWVERWGNTITAATLIAIGVLVPTGAIQTTREPATDET